MVLFNSICSLYFLFIFVKMNKSYSNRSSFISFLFIVLLEFLFNSVLSLKSYTQLNYYFKIQLNYYYYYYYLQYSSIPAQITITTIIIIKCLSEISRRYMAAMVITTTIMGAMATTTPFRLCRRRRQMAVDIT